MATIKRDDAIYLEIEQFEDHELTNNLAFEMAVRNNAVIDWITFAANEYQHNYRGYLRKIGIKYPTSGLYLQKSLKLSDEERKNLQKQEERKKPIPVYGATRTTVISDNNRVKFVSAIDSGVLDRVKIREGINDDELLKFLQKNFRNDINIEEFKTTYIDVETPPKALRRFIRDFHYQEFLEVVLRYEAPIRMKKREADIYASINTKRPLMMIENTAKIVTTSFNMALDIEELIAQISIIKKEFDNNFSDIKSVAEHFNIELEKAEILICDSKGKCIDPRSTLTKQQKMADMFFIYDAMKAGINEIAIKYQLSNYYLNDNGMDSKTIKKYKEITTKYIDNFGYKELLTGVKNI